VRLLFFRFFELAVVLKHKIRVGLFILVDGGFANRTCVFLAEPLLDAGLVEPMQTLKYHVLLAYLVIAHADCAGLVLL